MHLFNWAESMWPNTHKMISTLLPNPPIHWALILEWTFYYISTKERKDFYDRNYILIIFHLPRNTCMGYGIYEAH